MEFTLVPMNQLYIGLTKFKLFLDFRSLNFDDLC
jgi:hypothetical protein